MQKKQGQQQGLRVTVYILSFSFVAKKEAAGSRLRGAEELPWYHSRIKRMLRLWLQLAGCVEDGGEVARWITGTEEGKSKVDHGH